MTMPMPARVTPVRATFIDYGDAVSALVPAFGRAAAESAMRAASWGTRGPASLTDAGTGASGRVSVTDGGGYAVEVTVPDFWDFLPAERAAGMRAACERAESAVCGHCGQAMAWRAGVWACGH